MDVLTIARQEKRKIAPTRDAGFARLIALLVDKTAAISAKTPSTRRLGRTLVLLVLQGVRNVTQTLTALSV